MEQKIIFFDVDGTLFDHRGELVESAREAIINLKKKGHMLFINTGRSRGEITEELKDLSFDGYICSAGSYVEVEQNVIFHKPMDTEYLPLLYEYFEKHQILYLVETNEKIYANRKNYELQIESFQKLNLPGANFFMSIMEACDSMLEIQGVNKVLFFQSKIEIDEIKKQFGEMYTILPGTIEMLSGNHGEIFGKDIHKAHGMEIVLDYYGKTKDCTIAFGDGSNDLEMIQEAGIGIAMGNGRESLKKIANYVTGRPEEDGIQNALLHFGLL